MTYTEKIIDVATGEEIIRPFTKDETAEVENACKLAEAERLAAESEAAIKANAKAALLEKLGITEDEARLLLA